MKKILLGTTALIGAATLTAGAAFAGEDPKVTVGGFNTFEAGYTKSDFDQGEQNRVFRNNTEIHFNVAGKSEAGLGYGAEIDLNADISGASGSAAGYSNNGLNAHRTYGWLSGDQWGHVEFGSNDSSAATLKVDASNIARATGGINGDWSYFADVNHATTTAGITTGDGAAGTLRNAGGAAKFITSANLPVENGPSTGLFTNTYNNDTKITYYTPRFSGFQLGASYAPSLSDAGQVTTRVDTGTGSTAGFRDVFSGGLNYQGTFDQFGLAAAATGEVAHSNDATVGASQIQNIGAWNVGAKGSYMGWSLAASYGDWSKSADVSGTKADYWTGGIAYETGPVGASVTYLGSEDKNTGYNNKFQDISVGVDYKLAPGLTPFIEYTWYDINPTGAGTAGLENKGDIVLVGSQLSF